MPSIHSFYYLDSKHEVSISGRKHFKGNVLIDNFSEFSGVSSCKDIKPIENQGPTLTMPFNLYYPLTLNAATLGVRELQCMDWGRG